MKVLFQIGPSEAYVSEVADKLNRSESAVSHHIRILRMKGLVRWRRSGKAIYYVLKRLFSLRIIRNCWMNMTEMTEFVL
jgi:DNA-binding transcriptional ArsR family regulator